jgi:hypothetical protein
MTEYEHLMNTRPFEADIDQSCVKPAMERNTKMNDTELAALTALVVAEVSVMNAENKFREYYEQAPAYSDLMYPGMDCVRCLDAELRRRGVLHE